jgi:DNA-binding NtrC family response regulator
MIKPHILSGEHQKRFGDLLFYEENNQKTAYPIKKIPKKEVLNALNLLKSNYEIKKFSLRDHLEFNDWDISDREILFTPYSDLKKVHAGNVFIQLLITFIFGEDREKGDTHIGEFVEHIEYQVRILEDQLKRYKNYSDDIAHEFYYYTLAILKHLFLLLQFYENNQISYVKAFYKFYKYLTNYNDIVPHKKISWPYEYKRYGDPTKVFFNQIIGASKIFSEGFEMFGDNKALRDSYVNALLSAEDPYPVLILGETGTGKEIITKTIHEFSRRRNNNFKAINLAAVPENLFDAEISGTLKGAATGISSRLGIFLSASGNEEYGYRISSDKIDFIRTVNKKGGEPDSYELKKVGGTAFLDEINSISTFLQAKLLRIIEENEVKVLGEDRNRKFNAKVICASNVDLEQMVKLGKFRSDLYYRISGQVINLPPLRDMRESIIPIAKKQILKIKKDIDFNANVSLSKAAMEKIKNYDWPGNIREMNNILYGAMRKLRLDERRIISGADIIFPATYKIASAKIDNQLSEFTHAELEKKYINSILEKAGGNISKAKELAGFKTRTPLFTRMKNYGIK